MTVIFKVGRRVPRPEMRRFAQQAANLLSGQSNLWIMIKQALEMAQRKANNAPDDKKLESFTKTFETENENITYKFEWIVVTIRGTPEQEIEEYNDCNKMYDELSTLLKGKEVPKDGNKIKATFKTKMLSMAQIEKAYQTGFGSEKDKSVSQKLLEYGILTHLDKIDDHATRDKVTITNTDDAPLTVAVPESFGKGAEDNIHPYPKG